MDHEEKNDKSKSRVKELVQKFSSLIKTNPEETSSRLNEIKSKKKDWKKNDQHISIVQNRFNKDDLSNFRKVPFKKIQLQQVDEEQNYFNFRFNIQMPNNNKKYSEFPPLKEIELTLKQKEIDAQMDEKSSVSDETTSKSSLTTDSNTSMTYLEDEIKHLSSFSSNDELEKISRKYKKNQDSILKLDDEFDCRSDNDQICDKYSSDFFYKCKKIAADEETLVNENESETLITEYNMNLVQDLKASVLITDSSSSESCNEFNCSNEKMKKSKLSIKSDKIKNDDEHLVQTENQVNYQQQYTESSNEIKKLNENENLVQKMDKNGKLYFEIFCHDDDQNNEKLVKQKTDHSNINSNQEEMKKFLFSHVKCSNYKGMDGSFEYLSQEDKYVKFCQESEQKPTPKVTINFFKDIESIEKQNSDSQSQNVNDSEANIIDIPEMMSYFYDSSKIEVDKAMDKNWSFLDDKNEIVCLTECQKHNIQMIIDESKKLVLFCSGNYKTDQQHSICFEQVYEYIPVKLDDSFTNEDIVKNIRKKIEQLDLSLEKNMKEYHPIDYLKENLMERKSLTFLRLHGPFDSKKEILLGFENDENPDKIDWIFHNSLLSNMLLKKLNENRQKLFVVFIKVKEKSLRFDEILKRSKQPCEVYFRKEFQQDNQTRIVNHMNFNEFSNEQDIVKSDDEQFVLEINDQFKSIQTIPFYPNISINDSNNESSIIDQSIDQFHTTNFNLNENQSNLPKSTLNEDYADNEILPQYENPNSESDFFTKPNLGHLGNQMNISPFSQDNSESLENVTKYQYLANKINQDQTNNADTAKNHNDLPNISSPNIFNKKCEKSTPSNLLTRDQLIQIKQSSDLAKNSKKIQILKYIIESQNHHETSYEVSDRSNLLQHLRSFIHLTTQAPLEQICKSSLYILTRVPSTRHAVIEYISTFYRVTTFLHLRFNLNQKKPNYPDIQTDTKNILQINQVIDYIESSLVELIQKTDINEFWSVELCQPLLELIGDIVLNTAISFADSPGLSSEEIASFKTPTIADGLEIWNNQCRPTQSILFFIQKCLCLVPKSTQEIIIDLVLNTSNKYNARFDWVLCYLSSLKTDLLFQKFLQWGFKEYLEFHKNDIQFNQKLSRLNAINFFATNYSEIILEEISRFLHNSNIEQKMFVLRLASQTPGLLINLLDIILEPFDKSLIKYEFFKMLGQEDKSYVQELFNCIKQINNNVAVFEILTSVIGWLESQEFMEPSDSNIENLKILLTTFLDEMLTNIYQSYSEEIIQDGQSLTELVPFLKSLNSINGYSFERLVDKIVSLIKNDDQRVYENNKDIIYKLILCISISENFNSSVEIISRILRIEMPNYSDNDYLINKLRLETSSFHSDAFKNSIKLAIQSVETEIELNSLIKNLMILHDWDLNNQNYICQSLSSLMFFKENFIGLLVQLDKFRISPFRPIEFFNKILTSNEPDLSTLKLNISDLITISKILIDIFFDLENSIDDKNVYDRIKELNEIIDLIENISLNQLNGKDETNPFLNIILRNLIDKIFDNLKNLKKVFLILELEPQINKYDENLNLFTQNIAIINEEMSNRSKLKAVRTRLIDYPLRKFDHQKIKLKPISNLLILNLLQVIESQSKDKQAKSNLSDLIVQNVLFDDHYVDYQWPGSSSEDLDDNFDNEIEALKLFIERDMAVQNIFENRIDNNIIWMLLEFVADDEQAFIKAGPVVRSLLASLIIQWESYQEQPTRNMSKTLGITLRLLNIINKSNLIKRPYCFIVDILPMINSFETHLLLLIIWKNLKKKMAQIQKPSNGIIVDLNKNIEMKHLKYIFHKNISKLAYLYPKFFQNIET